MTLEQLLATVLSQVRADWYGGRDREFFRDRQALLRAIARYGYECKQRGWSPCASFIATEILQVLRSVLKYKADISYLPVYLHESIGRAVRQRAEEIQRAAQETAAIAKRVVDKTDSVEIIREPTTVEILAPLYQSLTARRAQRTIGKQKCFKL